MSLFNFASANIKTNTEIQHLKEGALIWQQIRKEITPMVKEGVVASDIELEIRKLFDKHQVKPAFNNYHDFPGYSCISINECVVHGLAGDQILKSGDKITLDIGFVYKDVFIDSAFTLLVDAEKHPDYAQFIEHGLRSLWAAVKAITPGCKTGVIAEAVEGYAKAHMFPRYSILNGYTGHGIGRQLHEPPHIYNKGLTADQGVVLPPNSVICIEPMFIEQENGLFKIGPNKFDVMTIAEKAQTLHWEHMVLITKNGVEVLTATEEEVAKYMS